MGGTHLNQMLTKQICDKLSQERHMHGCGAREGRFNIDTVCRKSFSEEVTLWDQKDEYELTVQRVARDIQHSQKF
jgi:hypothetical protein